MGKKKDKRRAPTKFIKEQLPQVKPPPWLPVQGKRRSFEDVDKTYNPTLPALWFDFLQISARADAPVVLMRCYTLVDDKAVEIARMQTSIIHLLQMGEVCTRVATKVLTDVMEFNKKRESQDPKTN